MTEFSNLIAAERRRRIHDVIIHQGSVGVTELAGQLGVVENTIRRDLDFLHKEGKVLRSHGGAIAREAASLPAPPYSQTRDANLPQKSRIGIAALQFMPASGYAFINVGSTNYQMVTHMPKDIKVGITTNSPEIALYIASNTFAEVNLIGGKMVAESLETDGTLVDESLDSLFWDVSFLGLSAIDVEHGITSINLQIARLERKIMEHSRKTIALCDSSKFGRFSNARAGEIGLIDVLITDSDADRGMVDMISAQGVQVLIIGESSEELRIPAKGLEGDTHEA